jgi:uncharacterized protein YkwD
MNQFKKTALAIGLAGIMVISSSLSALASASDSPTIARTKAWDGIVHTLGGIPKKVLKIEYAGSIFYLGKDVTEEHFLAVLEVGPEAVKMQAVKKSDNLYRYPAYIVWNADKTVLLVHPIIFDYDDVLEAVSISTAVPASLTESPTQAQTASEATKTVLTADQAIEYMLSVEYADAVRKEFYRLLNEHRAAHGLRGLAVNLELQKYADIRATELRLRFGHIRPDGSPAGSGWHNSQNYINSRFAENAVGVGAIGADPIGTAKAIFTQWKNSPGHNNHMLYNFDKQITMAFGIAPQLEENGFVTTGAIFASGF